MDWAGNVDVAAFGALVAAASGVLVPRIIERVPEPEPEAEPELAPDTRPDTRPDTWTDTRTDTRTDASPTGDAALPGPRFEGGSQAEEEPKETYVAIADSPGLLWKCVLAALVTGGLIGAAVGWDWSLLFLLPLVPVSLALTVIDWRTKLLPTWLIARTYLGLIVLVLVATLATRDWDDLVRAGIGWAGAGLLFFVLWYIHPRGLGYGDVRLSGILGIALGWVGTAELVVGVYAAFLLGGVGGGLLSMLRIVHRKGFPFGPFMFIGALVGLLFGDWVAGLTTM